MLYGHTVYCEDIREEADNQYTLVGVYRGGLASDAFPLALPKFGVVITYVQSSDEAPIPVKFKVFFLPNRSNADEDMAVFFEDVIPVDVHAKAVKSPLSLFEAHVRLVNVQISEPGRIGVRLYRGDEEIKLRAFQIFPMPKEEGPPPTSRQS
jgi:hypothetical protein